jgi:hypothetical protein
MVRRGMHMDIGGKARKKREEQEDEDVGDWIILKWILER